MLFRLISTYIRSKMSLNSKLSAQNLEILSKEDLLFKVHQLQSRVSQLECQISNVEGTKKKKKEKERQLDFNGYKFRHISLKFAYLGWNYHGLAIQADIKETVMEHLLLALEKTRLIETREASHIQCCGRTDKGVSGFSQVVSLCVRSLLRNPDGEVEGSGSSVEERLASMKMGPSKEIDYPHMLNRVLPPEIRVLAWAPTTSEFNARFSCTGRTYKYFFPQGNLDIEKMREAASKFVGEHDFRNFCKMAVKDGVVSFMRTIKEIDIECVDDKPNGYGMYVMTVKGSAFLYHQIRCMISILFLVGRGLESPEIVTTLLTLADTEGKPQYQIASDLPLLFYDVDFEGLIWQRSDDMYLSLIKSLQKHWCEQELRTRIIGTMLESLHKEKPDSITEDLRFQADCLVRDFMTKNHTPLLKRHREEPLKERIEKEDRRKRMKIALEDDG